MLLAILKLNVFQGIMSNLISRSPQCSLPPAKCLMTEAYNPLAKQLKHRC